MRPVPPPPQSLLPGTIVNAPMKGWLGLTRHFGIVSTETGPDGLPVMIANSHNSGGPAKESWSKFTEGHAHERAYYPSALTPQEVIANAAALFGTRYDLFAWNCEHFVNACHGLPARSSQVGKVAQLGRFALALALSGLVLAAMHSA